MSVVAIEFNEISIKMVGLLSVNGCPMPSNKETISACLVVYNEEAVIERCLQSIKGKVDEIIIVHDGPCADKTLEIAKRYTDKIFVREHAGVMEAHLVFAFQQAQSEWLFRVDADEFLDQEGFLKIKEEIKSETVDALILNWEMWNGKETISLPGLQKMCFMRKNKFHYCGVPHANGTVDGEVKKVDIFLHHRPSYNNVAWSSFMRKSKKWVPIHANYFFPENLSFECFNNDPNEWVSHTKQVRAHIWKYLFFKPIKMSLGQLKNGLWKSFVGLQVSAQVFVYYTMLYWQIIKKL